MRTGEIVGTSGANLQIKIGSGTIGVPLATIDSVIMTEPPQYAAALKAYEAKDYPRALLAAKAIADKYKGLPMPWAQHATSLVGDLHLQLKQLPEAEKAYQEYQKAYAAGGKSPQAEVGFARIDIAKKAFDSAKKRLEPIAAKALLEQYPPAGMGSTYSQAFYLLGEVLEAEGAYGPALESYLRAVTLFPQDSVAVAAAQEKADALRKAHNIAVP